MASKRSTMEQGRQQGIQNNKQPQDLSHKYVFY